MNNEMDDFESPGYEYLRSYESMISLHTKLLTLNYEKEFCLTYKCSPIHRFYFSLPNNNSGEQRYLFTCLCAWLIKDKCHMNLEIEPEEYEDLDVMLGVVIEALRLIIADDKLAKAKEPIKYPSQSRLRRAYGPEVIWTLNILADRALELLIDDDNSDDVGPDADKTKIRLIYRQSTTQDKKSSTSNSSITIGQPFVGGGLTTRPLGNYIIDDRSLLLDDGDDAILSKSEKTPVNRLKSASPEVDSHEWYKKVESSRHLLESVQFDDDIDSSSMVKYEDWSEEISQIDEVKKCVESFLDKSRPILESTATLIDKQLHIIEGIEKYLKTQMREKLDDFHDIYRKYSAELKRNKELLAQVDTKTDKFESLDNRLQDVHARIEVRKLDLNDGSKLDELNVMIDRLKSENKEYDTRIGLLLAVYLKIIS